VVQAESPEAKSQEPKAKSQKPKAKSQEPKAASTLLIQLCKCNPRRVTPFELGKFETRAAFMLFWQVRVIREQGTASSRKNSKKLFLGTGDAKV